MKRSFSLLTLAFLAAALPSLAQSLPELFGRLKDQIKAGSWADASKTLDALDAESSRSGNESARKQLEAPLVFYRGVCDANLDKAEDAAADFGAFLKLQPNATIDTAVYSKKAVAAFEKAQKAATDRAPSLAEAYKEFRPPADAKDRDPADQYWGAGPASLIMTAAEKTSWAAVTDPNARADFVAKFWDLRTNLPGSDGRTYRQEFERRVSFADAALADDEEQRGSLTDRGMVFILLGPPTYAGRRPMRTGDDKDASDGQSTFGSQDVDNTEKSTFAAQMAARGGHPPPSQVLIQKNTAFGGPGKKAAASGKDQVEVWHYRREVLPKGVPYQQVDFQFLTKKGYGDNVLQRETDTVTTIEVARTKAQPPAGGGS